jgi:signal transduction histidine kinase
MESSSHVKIIYQFFGEERSIGNTAEVYVYRIIQELVSNAIKHAEPTQIVVQMTLAEKNILLTIEDNGIGIDSGKKRNSSGIGLKSVQQRVDYLNGKLDFENNEPTGTVVNIELNA